MRRAGSTNILKIIIYLWCTDPWVTLGSLKLTCRPLCALPPPPMGPPKLGRPFVVRMRPAQPRDIGSRLSLLRGWSHIALTALTGVSQTSC
jgi:hypothetical protein